MLFLFPVCFYFILLKFPKLDSRRDVEGEDTRTVKNWCGKYRLCTFQHLKGLPFHRWWSVFGLLCECWPWPNYLLRVVKSPCHIVTKQLDDGLFFLFFKERGCDEKTMIICGCLSKTLCYPAQVFLGSKEEYAYLMSRNVAKELSNVMITLIERWGWNKLLGWIHSWE